MKNTIVFILFLCLNAQSVSIFGKIKNYEDGVGVGGVNLSVEGIGTITTSNNPGNLGAYSVIVPEGWSGTITPLRYDNYCFSPTSKNYENVTMNWGEEDYEIATGVSVNSEIYTDINTNKGLIDVIVYAELTDGCAAIDRDTTAVIGVASLFFFPGWSGYIRYEKEGYTFDPGDHHHISEDQNVHKIQTAIPITPKISGYVTDNNDSLENVTISFDDSSVTSDNTGYYYFEVDYKWSGTVTPTKSGYEFTSIDIDSIKSDTIINISANELTPAEAPTQISPANNLTDAALDQKFLWNKTEFTTFYKFQITLTSDFSEISEYTTTDTFYNLSLTTDTVYYWNVCATNDAGEGPWSPVWKLKTAYQVPSPPTLYDTSYIEFNRIMFDWEDQNHDLYYDIEVDTESDFSSPVMTKNTDVSFAFMYVEGETTYYWRVRATNSKGTSDWSLAEFTTGDLTLYVTLVSPENNSENISVETPITFKWNSNPDINQYRFELAEDSLFSEVIEIKDGNDTTYEMSKIQLAKYSTYYWRVHGYDEEKTPFSPVFCFTTELAEPNKVDVISPPNGNTMSDDSITLMWNKSLHEVTSYWVEVSTNEEMSDAIIDSTCTDTFKIITDIEHGNTYWWRVRAKNGAGYGNFSDIKSFTISIPTNIRTSPYTISEISDLDFKIYNLTGQSVYSKSIKSALPGQYDFRIPESKLATSPYIIIFRSNNALIKRKVLF